LQHKDHTTHLRRQRVLLKYKQPLSSLMMQSQDMYLLKLHKMEFKMPKKRYRPLLQILNLKLMLLMV